MNLIVICTNNDQGRLGLFFTRLIYALQALSDYDL